MSKILHNTLAHDFDSAYAEGIQQTRVFSYKKHCDKKALCD